MSQQQTLMIIKPDGMSETLIANIINCIQESGLFIVDRAKVQLTKDWAEQLYVDIKQEPYLDKVINWITSAPVLLLKICGNNAVYKVKFEILGKYPNGIRGQYSKDNIKNVAHASDSEDSAERELQLAQPLFKKRQIKESSN